MNEIIYTSHLMGGLGNQMFQIANTLSQGYKNNKDCFFIKKSETPGNGNQPTNYINNIFRNINFKDYLDFDVFISEKSWNDANIVIPNDKSIKFYGYFQSSKNFLGYDEEIKKVFSPDIISLQKINSLYPDLEMENTVSIHIRRGDYLTIKNILPVIDKSYIDYCLKQIDKIDKIFVFSTDKVWVESNLNYPNMVVVDNLKDFEELWMISLCKYNIMSNSTFSWWGSYLNTQPKKIFCPSIWFGPDGPNPYYNIFEKNWEKINVNYKNGFLVYEEKN
jgi:hypothetical protein